jgi:hypothetical protein
LLDPSVLIWIPTLDPSGGRQVAAVMAADKVFQAPFVVLPDPNRAAGENFAASSFICLCLGFAPLEVPHDPIRSIALGLGLIVVVADDGFAQGFDSRDRPQATVPVHAPLRRIGRLRRQPAAVPHHGSPFLSSRSLR